MNRHKLKERRSQELSHDLTFKPLTTNAQRVAAKQQKAAGGLVPGMTTGTVVAKVKDLSHIPTNEEKVYS